MKAVANAKLNFRPVTTAGRVYETLLADIVAMRLAPGSTLVERELCLAFGVSRTPVREALLRLAEERLVDIYGQIGTFVSRIAAQDVSDALAMRLALEVVTAKQAAEKADQRDVEALRRILSKQKECAVSRAFDDFHAADEAMHKTIADLAGHPNFWRVIKREKAQIDRFRMLTLPVPQRLTHVVTEHRAIIDAIAKHDPAGAAAAMQSHLERVLPVFADIRRAHPDYFEPEAAPERRTAG